METRIISETTQEFNGERYYRCGAYYQRKGKRLHRVVWEYHNGEIPKGYHIHHKDGDRNNNDISNLELKEAKEHLSEHMTSEKKNIARDNIQKAISEAPKWHGSKEGKEWHSKHAKEYWENAKPMKYTCDYCGKEFETTNVYKKGNHFCSNNCKSAYRHKSGVDNVTRICEKCGKEFVTNKYSKTRYCSLLCARHSRKWKGGTEYEG